MQEQRMDEKIIINGTLSDGSSGLQWDRGYAFGLGLFETLRVKEKPLFLDQHCERLNRGLARLHLGRTVEGDRILDCIQRYGIADCVLKIAVSEKNCVLSTRPFTYTAQDYVDGFQVQWSAVRRNASSHAAYLKTFNYLDNLIERETAIQTGHDEVFFLNTSGEVAEGGCSNIFFVSDGRCMTPAIGCGVLDGIIRRWVMSRFDVNEGRYTQEQLLAADEIFITNSVVGIMKVCGIAGQPTSRHHPFYDAVHQAYETCISASDA